MALAGCAALLCAACGQSPGSPGTSASGAGDAAIDGMGIDTEPSSRACDDVEIDGDLVIERERDFTATYRMGEPYTKTIMLFGGEVLTEVNVLANAYIIGLDKEDALVLAQQYPDFYLCSSPGGVAAAAQNRAYDFVPADCGIYGQLATALRVIRTNMGSGGDRTSIRFDGVPLTLESVIQNDNGVDVTEQVTDQMFHLVTSVEQLTGESVLSFGTSE